ncbi:type II toxin-antitoxin system death-on-curing family toxin [Meiothermus sp.]|jgi:death-on-curing protein|uniref:type II toxin-antitoxin system death-on-curing family toxin n=1 Tax=Meiothermus sp. TaxID=1955249 RepID=UPI0021DD8AEE|nr:type II toxin-antitoxin system death-on-curing family toxin [Meiothermus sp.]GIW25583.1 MAG: death-on-curing protein [Meiothermus sp.]
MSRWLTLGEVLLLHDLALELDGGDPGVLDLGKLESVIVQPQAGFGETRFHPILATQAAAYLFHISQAHTFNDGNKRTAVLAALTFLELNGLSPTITQDGLFVLALEVAKGNVSKEQIAHRLVTGET